jgi:hypothetical protein
MTHRALRLFQQRVLISASCARDYPLSLAPSSPRNARGDVSRIFHEYLKEQAKERARSRSNEAEISAQADELGGMLAATLTE